MVMKVSENGTDISQDDMGSMEETPEDTILSNVGFQLDVTVIIWKDEKESIFITLRLLSVHTHIVKWADFDVPEWHVTGFGNIHNHEMLKSNEVHLLPAYCTIFSDDKSRICIFAKASWNVGVKLGCLPFTETDARNLLLSFRNVNQDNDAIDLIAKCKKLKDEDHSFKYNFKIGRHNRLEDIVWSYASSVHLYEAFSDAVVFDTTHHLDACDMRLGIWVGVDNHGMTCFFSCVLLADIVDYKSEMPQKLNSVFLKQFHPLNRVQILFLLHMPLANSKNSSC
ncbi:hypothetical protein D5086_020133 [Populus alba]|uniref:Uncharacterized protein n=1 Tax=Populus alba TaxID=43335 RepID=A0ACC4BJK4_POPAL